MNHQFLMNGSVPMLLTRQKCTNATGCVVGSKLKLLLLYKLEVCYGEMLPSTRATNFNSLHSFTER